MGNDADEIILHPVQPLLLRPVAEHKQIADPGPGQLVQHRGGVKLVIDRLAPFTRGFHMEINAGRFSRQQALHHRREWLLGGCS
ncbi:hypothetical protein D3C75_976570 [compost metagenome]